MRDGGGLDVGRIHSFVPEANINVMVISSIMLLVPGLAITNAIRDTMSTDYLSGLARGAEAFYARPRSPSGLA